MLTSTRQIELADAMAQMMRACLLAATRAWTRPALRGLSLWSDLMLPASDRKPESAECAGAASGSYASYRSGGGHATAQIIVARE